MPSKEYKESIQELDELDALVKLLPKNIDDAFVDVVLELHAEIVERSPVDTGWYRLNNRLSFGEPPSDVVGDPKTTDPETAGRISIEKAKSLGIPAGIPELVVLFNNVPYAARIERGWSKQAPRGVYAVSAEAIEHALRQKFVTLGIL